MWEDPIVAEIHRIRDELSAKFNYDVHAIFEDLRKRQEALGDRLVRLERDAASGEVTPSPRRGPSPAPAGGSPG